MTRLEVFKVPGTLRQAAQSQGPVSRSSATNCAPSTRRLTTSRSSATTSAFTGPQRRNHPRQRLGSGGCRERDAALCWPPTSGCAQARTPGPAEILGRRDLRMLNLGSRPRRMQVTAAKNASPWRATAVTRPRRPHFAYLPPAPKVGGWLTWNCATGSRPVTRTGSARPRTRAPPSARQPARWR